MKTYLWIALGSALGGMARHWLTIVVTERLAAAFPWGTFLVNASGSLLIGIIAALPEAQVPGLARSFLMVGVLGGYTTFSAFSLQTAHLFTGGHAGTGVAYAIASLVTCPLLAWLGWYFVHRPPA